MLINIIHNGSLPDSNSTTYPMGASLSDIFFSFVLENILSTMNVDWGPPHLILVVCYMFRLLIFLLCKTWFYKGLQQRLQKVYSRCNKNTCHVEYSYMLQPPKYLLLFVNRFRYINNNVTKDRCSMPMDATVRLGPLRFSLRVTIDHHGPSIHFDHFTAYINCCKNILLQRSHNYRVCYYWQQKNHLLHMLYYMNWLTHDYLFDSNRRVGVWSFPWRWHILFIPLTTGRGTGVETCGLDDVFPPDDLCSRPEALVLIYIYIYALLYEFCFLWFTNCVLLSDDNSLIPGCWWLLAFVLNNTRYLVFYNHSPPRMFLSLDLLSEYRIQHEAMGPVYVTSSYSSRIFCRGVSGFAIDCPCDVWCGLTTCLLHVGPPFIIRFLNASWAVGLTYWIVYLNFFVFGHMQLYMSWYIISFFWLYLYFLNILFFFKYSCTNIFHRRSLCTFYRESQRVSMGHLGTHLVSVYKWLKWTHFEWP